MDYLGYNTIDRKKQQPPLLHHPL